MKLYSWYMADIDSAEHCHQTNYGGKRNIGEVDTIVIHYTGNNGDTAQNNLDYFSGANRNASAHLFVDTTSVRQSVFFDEVAWHVTGHNAKTIGIEMCSVMKNGEFAIPNETQLNAARVAAQIALRYDIKNIVRHYDLTRKHCPEPFVRVPSDWMSFISEFKNQMIIQRYNQSVLALSKAGKLDYMLWSGKTFDEDMSWLMHKYASDAL